MNDHDRQRWYGPLQPPEPDPWHDRRRGLNWPLIVGFVLSLAGLINGLVLVGERL